MRREGIPDALNRRGMTAPGQGIEKPHGFFDAKEGILRAPEILTDFRAAH